MNYQKSAKQNLDKVKPPRCQWCEAEKEVITGLCSKCHRFPGGNYYKF